jgi:hypothetical protein
MHHLPLRTNVSLASLASLLLASPLTLAAPPAASPPTAKAAPPVGTAALPSNRPGVAPYKQISKVLFDRGEWYRVGSIAIVLTEGDGSVVGDVALSRGANSSCSFRILPGSDPKALTGRLFFEPTGVSATDEEASMTRCKVQATIPLQRASGERYTVTGTFTIPLRPHQLVRITDTARLRNWLKPLEGLGCTADDANGKLGERITAGPAGSNCRADFMVTSNRNAAVDWSRFNALPEGTLVRRMTWKLEGDKTQCQLCSDPRTPCREPIQTLARTLQTFRTELIGPIVQEGDTQGVTTHWDPVRNQTPDVMTANQVIIAKSYEPRYREYMNELYSEMSCSPWAPPPNAVGGAVGSAVGQVAQGQAPSNNLPSAPRLRLVLDAMEFIKPPSVALPF